MAKKLIAAAAATVLWVALTCSAATAATGSQTFRIVFAGDPHAGAVGQVFMTGVINAVGSDRNVGSTENPDGSVTDLDQVTLPGGSITIRNVETVDSFDLDPTTCIARISASGPWTISAATGRYGGSSGGGTFTAKATVLFGRSTGGCSETPLFFFAIATVIGTVTVP